MRCPPCQGDSWVLAAAGGRRKGGGHAPLEEGRRPPSDQTDSWGRVGPVHSACRGEEGAVGPAAVEGGWGRKRCSAPLVFGVERRVRAPLLVYIFVVVARDDRPTGVVTKFCPPHALALSLRGPAPFGSRRLLVGLGVPLALLFSVPRALWACVLGTVGVPPLRRVVLAARRVPVGCGCASEAVADAEPQVAFPVDCWLWSETGGVWCSALLVAILVGCRTR